MSEQTEKKAYNNAPLAEKEYYAKPKWHEVAVNEKSGNLVLTVLWDVCDKDGHTGNFDMETGAETPLPEGADSWEAPSNSYVIAFADEAKNLSRCKGKDIEYLKDVCPKTYERMKRILEWCPDWDAKRAMWFSDCRDVFYSTVVRITVVHEEYNGVVRAKVKWTNPRDRVAKEVDTTETRQKITSAFGGFFDVAESAPAPKAKAAKAKAAKASAQKTTLLSAPIEPPTPDEPPQAQKTKADCWATYCRVNNGKDPALWYQLLKEFGKKESAFTPEDWAKLDKQIEETPPF